jgi:hypothetical protein
MFGEDLILAALKRRMFADTKPLDVVMFFMELAVLLLIAYEVIDHVLAKRAERRRKALVNERVGILRNAMLKGQELQHSVPQQSGSRAQWEKDVDDWTENTRATLKAYSAHAETAFMHEHPVSPNQYGSVASLFHFARLLQRLGHLQGIIEKPDVYF